MITNKTSSAVIQGIGGENSENFGIKTTTNTSTKTVPHAQTSQATDNKKSDTTDVKTGSSPQSVLDKQQVLHTKDGTIQPLNRKSL